MSTRMFLAEHRYVVLTTLKWCDERERFVCTWIKVREKVKRPRYEESLTIKHYRELDEMKREQIEKQTKAGKFIHPKTGELASFPTMAEYLLDCFWDDGKPRECCTLSIKFLGDNVQLSMNDKELRRSITTTAESLQDAMDAMERCLAAGRAPWRPWGKERR